MRQRPGDLAAARDWRDTQQALPPRSRATPWALGRQDTGSQALCSWSFCCGERDVCAVSRELVALGKRSFESWLAANLTFGQRPKERETPGQVTFQAEGTAHAKALEQDGAWRAAAAGRPGWLGQRERGGADRQVVQGLGPGGSPGLCRAGKGCVET